MKKVKLSSIFAVGLFLLCAFFSVNSLTAQDDPPCETVVFVGTQTFFPGSEDPFEWECQDDFTDCTEVYITCDVE